MLAEDSNHSDSENPHEEDILTRAGDAVNARTEQVNYFKQKLQEFSFRAETPAMAPRTRQGVAASLPKNSAKNMVKSASTSSSDVTQKAKVDDSDSTINTGLNNSKKRKRAAKNIKSPTAKDLTVNPVNNLKDSLKEGLILVSIGVNPGIMTGLTGS